MTEEFIGLLVAEKPVERHKLTVSTEMLQGWLREQGATHVRRRKRPHRAWRVAKP